MTFFHCLSSFDFLGKGPSLFLFSKKRNITTLGIILSFICFSLITSFSIYFIVKLFSKESFTSSLSVLHPPMPAINLTGMPILLQLVDGSESLLKNPKQIYSFQLQPFVEAQANGELFLNDFEICNFTKHFPKYVEYLKNINESEFQCPIGLDEWNAHLIGAYGSNQNAGRFSIIVNRCVNTTESSNCLPREKIEEKIQSVYLRVGYLDYELDYMDYEKPLKIYAKFEFLPMSGTIYKRYMSYKKTANLITDDGLVFSNPKEFQFYQYEKTELTVDLRNSTKFGMVAIVLSANFESNYRKYLKVQDIIASIGGVINLFLVICGIIVNFYSDRLLFITLGNENFKLTNKTLQTYNSNQAPTNKIKSLVKVKTKSNSGLITSDLMYGNLKKFKEKQKALDFGTPTKAKEFVKKNLQSLDQNGKVKLSWKNIFFPDLNVKRFMTATKIGLSANTLLDISLEFEKIKRILLENSEFKEKFENIPDLDLDEYFKTVRNRKKRNKKEK